MKTWEMLKELTENPNKRFKMKGWTNSSHFITNRIGSLVDENGVHYKLTHYEFDDRWEEVIQEVTWQEALEAWSNGKLVKVIFEWKGQMEEHTHMGDEDDIVITKDDVNGKSKWYIL